MEEKVKVNWSFSALEMLAELYDYLAEISEQSANSYVDGIYESVAKLESHPEACSPCRNASLKRRGFRCCKFRNHIIVYEFPEEKTVNILAIIHSKMGDSTISELV